MNKYTVVFKYSSDGEHWCHTSRLKVVIPMLKLLVYAKQDKSFSLCEALFQGMHLYALL